MILDGKPASAIGAGDLERLTGGQAREGQRIDYDQALPDAWVLREYRSNSASILPHSPMLMGATPSSR